MLHYYKCTRKGSRLHFRQKGEESHAYRQTAQIKELSLKIIEFSLSKHTRFSRISTKFSTLLPSKPLIFLQESTKYWISFIILLTLASQTLQIKCVTTLFFHFHFPTRLRFCLPAENTTKGKVPNSVTPPSGHVSIDIYKEYLKPNCVQI